MTDPIPPTDPTPIVPTDPTPVEDPNIARITSLEEALLSAQTEGAKFKELIDQLGAVLNPDKQPTVEELSRIVSDKDKRLKDQAIELGIIQIAGVAGSSLLDSRKFMASVSGLEPGSPEFSAKVTEAVSKLSSSTTIPAGIPTKGAGAELNGGKASHGDGQLTQEDLKTMTPAQIMKAYTDGKMANMTKGE